jgi:hypothetical protein
MKLVATVGTTTSGAIDHVNDVGALCLYSCFQPMALTEIA